MQDIYNNLKQFGRVKLNEALAKHVTMKIGGNAKYFVMVKNNDSLVALLQFLDAEGMRYMILGGGSNTLFSDDGYDGVVIKLQATSYKLQNNMIIADGGCSTVEIARVSMVNKLTGFEWGVGIPGTIGGAVRGNAGAMGSEMKDSIQKVEVYRDGEVIEMSRDECEFAYRDSMFKHNHDVILRVYLALEKTENNELAKQAIEHLQYRNKTQPQGFASSGCIFKNPDTEKNKKQLLKHFDEQDEKIQQFLRVGKISAGWLVEQVGLKGFQVGDAQISEKHGNFIVNKGNAQASGILTIIEKVKEMVYTSYGIEMELEISNF